MFEWSRVSKTKFENNKGLQTYVKLRYEGQTQSTKNEISIEEHDIDTLALERMGTELETFRLMNNNLVDLCEYNFDLSKIKRLFIP